MFTIKVRVHNTRGEIKNFVYVVDIQGVLDTNSYDEFQKKLEGLIKNNNFNIILNFSKLEFISSTCLGLLLKVVQSARGNGGDLCLLSPAANIQKVIKILGFSKFFRIFQDEMTAVRYFEAK